MADYRIALLSSWSRLILSFPQLQYHARSTALSDRFDLQTQSIDHRWWQSIEHP